MIVNWTIDGQKIKVSESKLIIQKNRNKLEKWKQTKFRDYKKHNYIVVTYNKHPDF